MAKKIDLTGILSNEKPTITINGKDYTVNDEKSNVLMMNSEIAKLQKANGNEFEIIDRSLEMLLGKKAAKEIDDMKLSISNYQTIFMAAMAVIQDEELDVVKERFLKGK